MNEMIQLKPKRIPEFTLKSLPWDILRIILNYTQNSSYKTLKGLNKEFNKLITERKSSVTLSSRYIPALVFAKLIKKSQGIKEFSIGFASF